MKTIPIFTAEQSEGLAETIQAEASISYASLLEPYAPTLETLDKAKSYLDDSKAGVHDDDLFFGKSILVSSNWNKNTDVFAKSEVWSARFTPTHKPTNIEHDEKQLVGHMTSTWAIDNDYDPIPEDVTIDELPDLYHLIVGSVIYLNWEDEGLNQRTKDLVKAIDKGEKYVSMECFFTNFDYAMKVGANEYKVVARSEETAFLTKHLRQYGGSGVYDGQEIGRVLRNITFCGKGYVDTPANPNSIIFNSKSMLTNTRIIEKHEEIVENGVLSRTEGNALLTKKSKESIMSDILERENSEAKKTIEKLTAEIANLLESQNEEARAKLEATISDQKLELVEADETIVSKDAEIATLTEDKSKAEEKIEEVTKSNQELEDKIKATEEDIARESRVSSLVSAGVEKDKASSLVDSFVGVSDEQFDIVIAQQKALIEAQNSKNETVEASKTDETDKESEETEAVDETLNEENVETTTDELAGAASTDGDDDQKQKELEEFVAATMGCSDDNENKGDK